MVSNLHHRPLQSAIRRSTAELLPERWWPAQRAQVAEVNSTAGGDYEITFNAAPPNAFKHFVLEACTSYRRMQWQRRTWRRQLRAERFGRRGYNAPQARHGGPQCRRHRNDSVQLCSCMGWARRQTGTVLQNPPHLRSECSFAYSF